MRGVTHTFLIPLRIYEFQSTRLMRGVTGISHSPFVISTISIHTPHARRDIVQPVFLAQPFQFQSTRLMRGVTPSLSITITNMIFQSTRLMRGVTITADDTADTMQISIHTPHARRDTFSMLKSPFFLNFNPHASCEA